MKRKIVALTLASVLTASLFTGCGAGEDKKESGNAQVESGETQDGDQTYTMFMRNTYVGWIEELKWYDAAEEATGIHVEYVEGPDDFNDCYAEVDQRIISETLPDAVMTKLTQQMCTDRRGHLWIWLHILKNMHRIFRSISMKIQIIRHW